MTFTTKLFAFAILSLGTLSGQSQQTVFKAKVFDAVTTPQASAPLPNIGQAVHVMSIFFPTATADVTGIVFRTEASFDNVTYFPISEDITAATYNGTYAYAISRCNAPYPYVRLRYVTADAGNHPLTANYTGSLQPIGLVKLSGTRYLADSPLAGATADGPGISISGNYYVYNRRMTAIVPAQWSSVNLDALTVRNDGTSYIMLDSWANAQTWQMVCRSLPASPYHIRIHYLRLNGSRAGDNPNQVGVMLRNSSDGKMIINFLYLYNTWAIAKWASFNSENSQYLNNVMSLDSQPIQSIDIVDDGTNRIWRWWDGMETYRIYQNTAIETQLRTDYTTPNQICFGNSGQNGNYRTQATLVGYDISPTW